MKPAVWLSIVADAMANVEIIPAPPESGTAGMFMEMLETFLTNRKVGKKVEDMLTGKPYEDEEHGMFWFKLKDFKKFLENEGVRDMSRSQVSVRLKNIKGAVFKDFNHKNKHHIGAWGIPSGTFMNGFPVLDTPEDDSGGSEI